MLVLWYCGGRPGLTRCAGVGSGIVESLSRPGGNATGFMMFEYNLSAKWLELLKQIAPAVAVIQSVAAVGWDRSTAI